MHDLDGVEMDLKVHRIVASKIDDDKTNNKRTTGLFFPGNINCDTDHFNYGCGRSSRSTFAT